MNSSKSKVKVETLHLNMKYEGNPILRDISVDLHEREFVAILGPSGCGKSTLFNIIAGLIEPESGDVLIDGLSHKGKSGRVSYMHQKDLLLPWKTILDNVCIPLVLKGWDKSASSEKALGYFELFGLNGFEKKYPHQLSGGMKQRAALLRTYLFSDDIILLDEPFGGLDAITKRKMQAWLLEVLETLNASVFFITHDIEEAILLSDRIYVLSERPASVAMEIPVDIERPRDPEIVTSQKFNVIRKQILELLR